MTTSIVPAISATLSNVSGSASSVTLLAANASRRNAIFVNDSTAVAYVKFGSTASATSYTVQMAGTNANGASYYELPAPVFTGIITCIWASATGAMRITEIT